MHVVRGSPSLFSSHGRGIGPEDVLKKDSRGLSWVAAGNPGFHRLVPVTSGSFSACLWEVRVTVGWEGPLGTPLGLVQWKRASWQVEAGTTGFLCLHSRWHRFVYLWHSYHFLISKKTLICILESLSMFRRSLRWHMWWSFPFFSFVFWNKT